MKERNIFIDRQDSLLLALKKMDEEQVKLLLVMDKEKFFSIISIGDIQRAIIANKPLESGVESVLRKKITVARSTDSRDAIKRRMWTQRIECMPVIDEDNNLIEVLFWEDMFNVEAKLQQEPLETPVIVMAGGQGTRLKPITNIIPKPLVPIGEKPIIEIIIDNFHRVGVKDFLVSVNYKANFIESYFRDLGPLPYEISYFKEDQPLGTAGGLLLMKERLDTTFFVSNCDILVDQDYREIYNYHTYNKNLITIVAALHHYKIPYGTLETEKEGRLIEMIEKPELTFKINTGMYVMEPEVLEKIPASKMFHMTDLIEAVKDLGEVGVFPVTEKSWMDIGQWNEYQQTLKNYAKRFRGIS